MYHSSIVGAYNDLGASAVPLRELATGTSSSSSDVHKRLGNIPEEIQKLQNDVKCLESVVPETECRFLYLSEVDVSLGFRSPWATTINFSGVSIVFLRNRLAQDFKSISFDSTEQEPLRQGVELFFASCISAPFTGYLLEILLSLHIFKK